MPRFRNLTLTNPGLLQDVYGVDDITVQVNKVLLTQVIVSVVLNGATLTLSGSYPASAPHYYGTVAGVNYEVVFETISGALRATKLVGG